MFRGATDLVTSLEVKPIRCATTLCHFGQSRNDYVATYFTLLSRIAERSAKSGCVVIRERFGQIEEPTSRNEEETKKNPSFVHSSGFDRCNM